MELCYKLCSATEWAEAVAAGNWAGSAVDRQDGYIHFSTSRQLAETAARHFAGREGLVLIALDSAALGDALKWEASRGGDLFPHLYGPLPVAAAVSVRPVALGPDGLHILPEATL